MGFGYGFGQGFAFTSIGGQSRGNADALAYLNAAGISDTTERAAVNAWAEATQSLRDAGKIYQAMLISSSSFASSLYDFISLSQITFETGKTPNWSATDGWSFNGVNQYLDSTINAQSVPVNNGGLAAWSGDDTAIAGSFMGCTSGASDRFLLNPENASNLTRFGAYSSATTLSGTAGASNEFYAGYVLGASSKKLYRAQTEIGSAATAVAGTRPNYTVYYGGVNADGSLGSPSLRRMFAAFITQGLVAADHNTLEAATRTYLTAIGRI